MSERNFETDSGIIINELYTGSGNADLPGEFPYTRGVQKDMYRGRLWTMRQYAGFSTAEESNKRYKYLLANGTMGLSVAFDLPTQIGYDSDHNMSEGEVGKVGVAIDSLQDMEVLFNGIELEKITTSMTINATASTLYFVPESVTDTCTPVIRIKNILLELGTLSGNGTSLLSGIPAKSKINT
jgi:methylmalonyl-CoA mutase N-terminal domain/subunit